jgi:hypothetical protein
MAMKAKIILAISLVLAIGGGLAAVKILQTHPLGKGGKPSTQPPETISTTLVEERTKEHKAAEQTTMAKPQTPIPPLVREGLSGQSI